MPGPTRSPGTFNAPSNPITQKFIIKSNTFLTLLSVGKHYRMQYPNFIKFVTQKLTRLRRLAAPTHCYYRFSSSEKLQYLRFAEFPGLETDFPQLRVIDETDTFSIIEISNSRYYWPKESSMSGLAWMHQEVFQPANVNFHAYEFSKVRISPGSWVLDAGASEGFFTRYALDKGAFVCAIEPVHRLAEALSLTFKTEIEQGKVVVFHGALGDRDGNTSLSSQEGLLCETQTHGYSGTIPMITIDSLSNQLNKSFDFIKMDIEGAETKVLEGGRKLLASTKPKLAIAVYHQTDNAKLVIQQLGQLNRSYTLFTRGIFAWDNCEARPMMVFGY
jgi:FkbM family methyltransferase